MPKLYTVKVLRACVVNRAPREVGEEVSEVSQTDKNGLLSHGKIEVVSCIEASELISLKREEKQAAKVASKKAAKKAAKKTLSTKDLKDA